VVTIYHNPRCSKSRQTLELLQSKGIDPEVVLYLENPPDSSTLTELLKKLGMGAQQLLRRSEPQFKDNFRDRELTEMQLVEAMTRYPKLIERPIVVVDDRAVLGRPPENVLEIIE